MKQTDFLQLSFLFIFLFFSSLQAKDKYLDNHSCNECHEKIYEEFQTSGHSHSYFTNTLHQKIADSVSKENYSCATCHMPMADNMKELLSGEARPDKSNKINTHLLQILSMVKKFVWAVIHINSMITTPLSLKLCMRSKTV